MATCGLASDHEKVNHCFADATKSTSVLPLTLLFLLAYTLQKPLHVSAYFS